MADTPHIPDEAQTRARWGTFAWTKANAATAKDIIARYPPERQQLEVMFELPMNAMVLDGGVR